MNTLDWFVMLVTKLLITRTVLISAHKPADIRICPDGYAHDQLFPDGIRYTCKPGPATGEKVMCHNIHRTLDMLLDCGKFSYMSGWHLIGNWITIRCCTAPGIRYAEKDCVMRINDVSAGNIYRINKEKVFVQSQTFDGGLTWHNKECRFRTKSRRLNYYNQSSRIRY